MAGGLLFQALFREGFCFQTPLTLFLCSKMNDQDRPTLPRGYLIGDLLTHREEQKGGSASLRLRIGEGCRASTAAEMIHDRMVGPVTRSAQ